MAGDTIPVVSLGSFHKETKTYPPGASWNGRGEVLPEHGAGWGPHLIAMASDAKVFNY